jgi:cobyrinic acid a,c-diamide synthase
MRPASASADGRRPTGVTAMTATGAIIAAPASGSGKTMLTLALLRAFRRQGLAVGSFKIGPDYLDPMFHTGATGRPCFNLDSWAMRVETLAGLGDAVARAADLVLGEGVMGLFDGAADSHGSTADLASLFDLPVILVVDARGMGASAAALVEGFTRHRDDVEVAGVIFNHVASERHATVLRRACDDRFAQPVLGCLPSDPRLQVPGRHLGLVQAGELPGLERFLDGAALLIANEVDLDRLKRLTRPFGLGLYGPPARPLRPIGQRIAIAADHAFAFAYPAILEGWRHAGAELVPFSPLANQAPDAAADAVYLPGGYPELHGGTLAAQRDFVDGLQAIAQRGAFVYGECGGFMVLGETLVDRAGEAHRMAGLLPVTTSFAAPRRHLGYRRLKLIEASPLGQAGTTFRGHEFHYASIVPAEGAPEPAPLFEATDARHQPLGLLGARQGAIAGSFMHLIDRTTEPDDATSRPSHLRVVED